MNAATKAAAAERSNYVTVRQAAKHIGMGEHKLRALAKAGQIPGYYVGTYFRVNLPALMKMLDTAKF